MLITCARCPNRFETQRPDARFCSDRCRTAAARARAAGLPESEATGEGSPVDDGPGPIESSLLADLGRGEATGAFDGVLAAAALSAAHELDRRPTAALFKELRDLAAKLEQTRRTAADSEMERFIASLSAPVQHPPQIPNGLGASDAIRAKRAVRLAGRDES